MSHAKAPLVARSQIGAGRLACIRAQAIIFRMDANRTMLPATLPAVGAARWLAGGAVRQGDRRITLAHSHVQGQWLGTIAGLFAVETAGERWLIGPRHAIWLPSGLAHAGRSHGAFAGWSLYAAADRAIELPGRPFTVAVSPLALALAERVIAQTGVVDPDARAARLAQVCWDEFADLPRSTLALPLPADPRLRRVTAAIDADPGDRRAIGDWAALAAMSPRSFIRRFAAETGLVFSAWRQRARLLAAQERLARGEPVTRVAVAVGYDSLGAFSTAFRRVTGRSPRDYASGLGGGTPG